MHRLKVQEETSKRCENVWKFVDDKKQLVLININQMQTNVLKLMQRGGRLVAPTPRGAEEDDRPHSGDEHVKLFEVRIRSMSFVLFVFVTVCLCFFLLSLLFVF